MPQEETGVKGWFDALTESEVFEATMRLTRRTARLAPLGMLRDRIEGAETLTTEQKHQALEHLTLVKPKDVI